jgi:hypothetical protein
MLEEVHDYLPTNAYNLALGKQGIKAARALHAYQEGDEQLDNMTTVELCELAFLNTGLSIWGCPIYLRDHLPQNSGRTTIILTR